MVEILYQEPFFWLCASRLPSMRPLKPKLFLSSGNSQIKLHGLHLFWGGGGLKDEKC